MLIRSSINGKKLVICGPTEKSTCRFPKEEKSRLEEWCIFCNTSPDKLLDSSRLCIEHFRETDLLIPFSDRPTLKFTAIPTIYTPDQLRRLKISSPSMYNRIRCQENCDVELKMSIVNKFKSILSENTSIQNANHAGNSTASSRKKVITDETIPVVFEPYSSSQRISANDNEVEETPSWMADVISPNIPEMTRVDICDNDALKYVEEIFIEAGDIPEVKMEPHTPTTDVINNWPISNTPQPIQQLVSPIIEKTDMNKPFNELQVTPTVKNVSNQSRSRSLRYIADIRTPDLETPQRREECLKIIRYENNLKKSKMRSLERQNKRLKEKVKTLKGLLLELRKKNLPSAKRSTEILIP